MDGNRRVVRGVVFDMVRFFQWLGLIVGMLHTAKLISNPTYDAFEKDIGMINIFFEKSHITRYVRANRMSTFDFVAQIGGSLGLFMGISLISIVEIIYWLLLRFFGKLF